MTRFHYKDLNSDSGGVLAYLILIFRRRYYRDLADPLVNKLPGRLLKRKGICAAKHI
jgi:hypothetical protein